MSERFIKNGQAIWDTKTKLYVGERCEEHLRILNSHDDLVAALKSAKDAINTMYQNADWSNGNTHPDYPGGDDEGAYLMMNFVERELGIINAALAKAEGGK